MNRTFVLITFEIHANVANAGLVSGRQGCTSWCKTGISTLLISQTRMNQVYHSNPQNQLVALGDRRPVINCYPKITDCSPVTVYSSSGRDGELADLHF